MTHPAHFTHCGLPGIDRVPFAMHACHFYRDRDELVAALAPYFAAGLRNRERCLWITGPPLRASEAVQALRAAGEGVDEALLAGALRVHDFDEWYLSSGRVKGVQTVQMWLGEEERALADGCTGLRIAGNTSFLTPADWPTFMAYEQAVTAHFSGRRIVALCSYALGRCSDQQVGEVLRAHHCAFEPAGADWQVVTSPEGIVGSNQIANRRRRRL